MNDATEALKTAISLAISTLFLAAFVGVLGGVAAASFTLTRSAIEPTFQPNYGGRF